MHVKLYDKVRERASHGVIVDGPLTRLEYAISPCVDELELSDLWDVSLPATPTVGLLMFDTLEVMKNGDLAFAMLAELARLGGMRRALDLAKLVPTWNRAAIAQWRDTMWGEPCPSPRDVHQEQWHDVVTAAVRPIFGEAA